MARRSLAGNIPVKMAAAEGLPNGFSKGIIRQDAGKRAGLRAGRFKVMDNKDNNRPVSTHDKAARINRDKKFYGTFAEIGAGQEVARWFFVVGGASGALAKTISAYDMAVSDAIYGKDIRYVSQKRLQKMLDYEFDLMVERLGPARGDRSSFFAFANTVAARSYKGNDECHGWMGIKFQARPGGEPSWIVMHVNMLDKENLQQQQALGIIGVNLAYGAFYLNSEPEKLIASLLDGLSTERIEVDMIKFTGPCFAGVDNRLMSLQLVAQGLTGAALIGAGGEVLQPSEVLWKKKILIERGSFRPVTKVNLDMLDCSRLQFQAEESAGEGEIVELMEITMSNLLSAGKIDHSDFLARADLINSVGRMVLISDYARYFKLASYLRRYTRRSIRIALGIPTLKEVLKIKYYDSLEGGILEAFGRLFNNDIKLYVYPFIEGAPARIVTADNVRIPEEARHLYDHLRKNGCIVPIENFRKESLGILSRNVFDKICTGDACWEQLVPAEVAKCIKARRFFGYKP